jgi:hypothetical protein
MRELETNADKVRNLGRVMRGGDSIWPDMDQIRYHNRLANSNMAVDEPQVTPFNAKEERENWIQGISRADTWSTDSGITSRQFADQNEDKAIAFNYITLIQNFQRKRKFDDISNEINQQNNVGDSGDHVSRLNRSLHGSLRKSEIPGKLNSDYSKFPQSCEDPEMQKVWNGVSQNNEFGSKPKRMKLSEETISSESAEMVCMDEARKRRDEAKRQTLSQN